VYHHRAQGLTGVVGCATGAAAAPPT
jgi:hypothetical protein